MGQMRTLCAIAAFALLASACNKGGDTGTPSTADQAPSAPVKQAAGVPTGWKPFTSDDGGFTVALPIKPQKTTQTMDNPAGGKFNISYYTSLDGKTAYVVEDTKMDANSPALSASESILSGFENGYAGSTKATVSSSTKTSIQGFPAHRTKYAGQVDSDTLTIVAGSHVYALIVARPGGSKIDEKTIDGFFDSLTIDSSKG